MNSVSNIETYKETLFKNANVVESKLPLTEEEIKNVISVTAKSSITDYECLENELNFSGKTVFTVLYEDNGAVKKCETGVEFSYKTEVKGLTALSNAILTAKTDGEKISALNGITSVSAVVTVIGSVADKTVTECEQLDETMLVKTDEKKCVSEICRMSKTFSVEDEFELSYAVKDVLCHDERIIISSVSAGIGVVNVSGSVEITAFLAVLDGDNVCLERKSIPFSFELECTDVYPDCVVSVSATVDDTLIKAYVDEGKNKSNFSIECNVKLSAKVFENISCAVVIDAYSVANELNIIKEEITFNKFLYQGRCENKISGDIKREIDKNDRLICVCGVKIENEEYALNENKLTATGIVSLVAVYKGDGKVKFTELMCPFSAECDISGNDCKNMQTEISNIDVRLTPSGFSYTFTLTVCYDDILKETENIVKKVEKGAEIEKNTSAISVFIPSAGDTLWDVSKALGVGEEEILKFNGNIEFPLTGEERIIVFREES